MTPEELRLQVARARRETMRWLLLVTMNVARPAPASVGMLLTVLRGEYPDATDLEIRRELDYLESRELISLHTDPLGHTTAKMERYGIDVHDYTVECDPGIARPKAGS